MAAPERVAPEHAPARLGYIPALEAIVCIDMKGLRNYRQSQLMSLEALCERGRAFARDAQRSAAFAKKPAERSVYTYSVRSAGSTGRT